MPKGLHAWVKVDFFKNTEKYSWGPQGPQWVQGEALAWGTGGWRPPLAPRNQQFKTHFEASPDSYLNCHNSCKHQVKKRNRKRNFFDLYDVSLSSFV